MKNTKTKHVELNTRSNNKSDSNPPDAANENASLSGASEAKETEIQECTEPREEIYRFGIMVRWFPALLNNHHDALEKIAREILKEIEEIGSAEIYMHRFPYGDAEIIIASSWDEEVNILSADADLVVYHEVIAEMDIDGDGKAVPILIAVPASEAKYMH